MKRTLAALAWMCLASACPGADPPPWNVDVQIGWQGCYRPMQWAPIDVTIYNDKLEKPVDVEVRVRARQDDLTRMTVYQPQSLTPKLAAFAPLVTKLAFAFSEADVSIHDRRGRELWPANLKMPGMGYSTPRFTPVGERDLLIGVADQGLFDLLNLGNNARCTTTTGDGKVYVKQKNARLLPWDWTGYASLDAMVLYNLPWDRMRPEQAAALEQWVRNGGVVLVVLGDNVLPKGHPLRGMLPCEAADPKQTSIPRDIREGWGFGGWDKPTPCWELLPRVGARVLESQRLGSGDTLYVVGLVGFGRVGVLAIDPGRLRKASNEPPPPASQPASHALPPRPPGPDWQTPGDKRQKEAAARFWVDRLHPLLGDPKLDAGNRAIAYGPGGQDDMAPGDAYETGLPFQGANGIMEHLLSIPELRPLSIWWVVGVLAVLALLLGPVDYFVLKALDIQPWTWVTSAVVVVLFTVGAYYGVQELRSGTMQVRVVSVVDAVQGEPGAWSVAYSGLFAPKSRDYRIEVDGDAPRMGGQWWSVISPSAGHLYEANQQSGSRTVTCRQLDGQNVPTSVPINIWSMQCLITEERLAEAPIAARILTPGRRRESEPWLEVENRSSRPLRSVVAYKWENGDLLRASLPVIPPGDKVQFSGALRQADAWHSGLPDGSRAYSDNYGWYDNSEPEVVSFDRDPHTAFYALGAAPRTRGLQVMLRRGAVVVVGRCEEGPIDFSIRGRDCRTHHVRLVRLAVFPGKEFQR